MTMNAMKLVAMIATFCIVVASFGASPASQSGGCPGRGRGISMPTMGGEMGCCYHRIETSGTALCSLTAQPPWRSSVVGRGCLSETMCLIGHGIPAWVPLVLRGGGRRKRVKAEDEEEGNEINRGGRELHGDKLHGQGWVQGDGESSVAKEEGFEPKASSQEAREDKAWMYKSETSEGHAAAGRPIPPALRVARHQQTFESRPHDVKASKASADSERPRPARSAQRARSERFAGGGRGELSKQDLEAKAAKLNAKYGVKVEKGINLAMLAQASAPQLDNAAALREASRSKADAEAEVRQIKEQLSQDGLRRPARRMDAGDKRELHARLRQLQQERGEIKRKVWELELKKKYNAEQRQRIAEGRKPFLVPDITSKRYRDKFKWTQRDK